jgi:hypothetical protein
MRASSDPSQGNDEPCCDYEEDERHRYEYEVAHSCTCFDVAITASRSEAFRLYESVEEVDEEPEGAETGEASHERVGHELAPATDEVGRSGVSSVTAPLGCEMSHGEAVSIGMSMRIDSEPKL